MQLFGRDPLTAHTSAVDTLAAAGIDPPPGWAELRDRITAAPTETMLARYIAAVVDGDRTADLAALRAGALAETLAGPQNTATINNAVKAEAQTRLRGLYAPAAESNYGKVADLFDAAATRLAAATKTIDPDTAPEAIVTADAKTRAGWADAALAAAELDRLVPVLQAAAELCGVSTARRESLLALTVDANNQPRREVWAAFDTTEGRAGRWGALIALGALVRAVRPVTDLAPYRQPEPMQERWEKTGRGILRRHVIDPEAVEPTPA